MSKVDIMEPKYRILIVDDDPVNIEILEEILGDNYILASAMSGQEALDMVQKFYPELILLDIMMPGMDGYEVCRKIRENKSNFCKIVLVSGKAMIEERLEGYEAGADDYITKPFMAEELEAKVRVFLQLKRTQEVDQIKSDLLSLFSHETRTPLNGIIGMASILLDEESLSDDTREGIEMILESGDYLLEFVKKTMLLCELKSRKVIHKTCESIKKNLGSVIEKFKEKASEKNLLFELDAQEVTLDVDWSLLDEAIDSVVDNAVKHSPKQGIVNIQSEVTNGLYKIHISDQGEGIEPEWIDKIFDEFAIKDVLHHEKGQGLSLAISKCIMELHGGTIKVKSTCGKGTEFVLSLPIDA